MDFFRKKITLSEKFLILLKNAKGSQVAVECDWIIETSQIVQI